MPVLGLWFKFCDVHFLHTTSTMCAGECNLVTSCTTSAANNPLAEALDLASNLTEKALALASNLTEKALVLASDLTEKTVSLASNLTEKAVSLVHLPSFTVFSNFPELMDTKIRIPWTRDLSPNEGLFTMGNHKGHALLYRVKHYSSS
ncbi:hypothetical protein ACOMHN_058574 [Nucella lapillus]